MKRRVIIVLPACLFPTLSSLTKSLKFNQYIAYRFTIQGEHGSILSEPIILKPDVCYNLQEDRPGEI